MGILPTPNCFRPRSARRLEKERAFLITDLREVLGDVAIEAGDGDSGLKVLQFAARIDLLITEVGLPGGMNGRLNADAGRERRPDLEVLFITGYVQNAILRNRYLKPEWPFRPRRSRSRRWRPESAR